ncbi:MAG: hypothetical protein COV66_06025 [Nitrospinae bacterium CG11_big_fil_rev_8_21_14_0_20_45_15]|nr:MAG: hypothetical protein COV66_06025 [Nitrospinae bacterium CG11_big_fil_rev_8_21_14_0_20_45_15]
MVEQAGLQKYCVLPCTVLGNASSRGTKAPHFAQGVISVGAGLLPDLTKDQSRGSAANNIPKIINLIMALF